MAHRQHQLDIYPVRLHLITTGKSWHRHHARIPMHQAEPSTSAGLTATTLDRHTATLHVTIWIDARWHTAHDQDLVATAIHEAAHAGASILDHFGQAYDGTSEALAYLIDWIAGWLREQLA